MHTFLFPYFLLPYMFRAFFKPETCKAEVNKEINKKNLCITLVIIQYLELIGDKCIYLTYYAHLV
jgi:hypothetical protein